MNEKSEEKTKMGIGKKAGIGCLALIVIFIAIGIIVSASTKDSTSTTAPSSSSSLSNPSSTPQQYKVGDTVQLKNHQIKVVSFQQGFKTGNQFDKPQSSDNEFVSVNVEVINSGKDSLDVNGFGFKLEDETGTQRNTTITTGSDELQSVTLSAGGKTSGVLYFEAKKSSSTLKLHYSPGLFGGSEVTIALK